MDKLMGVFDLRLRAFIEEDGEVDFAIERMGEAVEAVEKTRMGGVKFERATDRDPGGDGVSSDGLVARVYNLIARAGEEPVPKSQILRGLRGCKAKKINLALMRLIEDGRINLCVDDPNGRPVTLFTAVQPGLVAIIETGE